MVADFDGGTMPWVYLQSGGVYSLSPAPSSDAEDQEEMTAALRLFTAQSGVRRGVGAMAVVVVVLRSYIKMTNRRHFMV